MRNIFVASLKIGVLVFAGGCGADFNVSGETKHTVQGEARIVMSIDIEACDGVSDPDKKDQCIVDLIAALKALQELKEAGE